MEISKPIKPPQEEYSRSEQLVRQVIAGPESEIEKSHAQYEKSGKAAKKLRAA